MKTRFTFPRLLLAALFSFLLLEACKNKREYKEDDGQDTIDTRTLQGETDAAIGDANTVLSDQALLSGRPASGEKLSKVAGVSICGMSVDTTQVTSGILVLNFDGTTCNNRKREGKIKLTIVGYPLSKWKQAGTVLKLDYIDYKVTKASNGKFILLNGTINITNVNGGTWVDLAFFGKPNIVHEVKGTGIKVKFENSLGTAEYNIHRRFTYTFSNLVFTCKGEGIGTNDGISSLENWGLTRNGKKFTSQVNSPVIWNTTCGGSAPVDGEVLIKVEEKDFEVRCIFAVNSSGDEVTVAPNTCAYGWKLEWKRKNKSRNKVFAY